MSGSYVCFKMHFQLLGWSCPLNLPLQKRTYLGRPHYFSSLSLHFRRLFSQGNLRPVFVHSVSSTKMAALLGAGFCLRRNNGPRTTTMAFFFLLLFSLSNGKPLRASIKRLRRRKSDILKCFSALSGGKKTKKNPLHTSALWRCLYSRSSFPTSEIRTIHAFLFAAPRPSITSPSSVLAKHP